MHRFLGKTCIVTGGARGIGAAIATRLGLEGCTVAIFDIDEQAGQYRQRELEKNGIKAVFYKVDVASDEMVKQAVEDFYGKHGRIDILVNNAGIGFSGKSIEEQTLEEWRRIIDTNLTGTWLCTKHVVRYMKKTGGVIINIASTRAFQSEPNTEPYSASKGGIVVLSHALAVSLAKYHIRVVSISPRMGRHEPVASATQTATANTPRPRVAPRRTRRKARRHSRPSSIPSIRRRTVDNRDKHHNRRRSNNKNVLPRPRPDTKTPGNTPTGRGNSPNTNKASRKAPHKQRYPKRNQKQVPLNIVTRGPTNPNPVCTALTQTFKLTCAVL